ncbi:MAG: RtcB family protein [Candidatus Omnitrophica bacterium]|nr:RtcB family protein [Candidatus Omnitrophota bacterium]
MRVEGIIYASEGMLSHIVKDKAYEQVANVAFLPGIVKYSLAMPDIHWGYGFCLTEDTKILTSFGFYKTIKDFGKEWESQNLITFDLKQKKPDETSILRFIKLRPKEVFKVITKNGYEIKATGDHPLLTPLGMVPIDKLTVGEKIAIFPFEGIPYQKPSKKIIISEEDIRKTLIKLGRKPNTPKFEIVIRKLRERDLSYLTYNHPKLPYILKIIGFVFGDGSMNFIGKRGDGVLHFSGKPEDLERLRKDIEEIGYTPSPIHLRRVRSWREKNKYYNCYSFYVNASSLVVLLESLGVPRGSKVDKAYRVPNWIFKAPLWQKRLFLASLFGCELRVPHRRLERRGYFNAPVFPMSKREELLKNGEDFLKDITKLLKEFGVRVLYIDKRKRHVNKRGEISWALELVISPKPENLFKLWSKIGFEYNFHRAFVANVAVGYLKLRQKILEEKEEAIKVKIPRLLSKGLSYQKIALQLAGNPLTPRFIIDVCYKLNKGKGVTPRIPFSFPSFQDYLKEATWGLGMSGMIWDKIEKIEKISHQRPVFDFTVSHPDHNFVANNFVVSNCIGGVAATDPDEGGVISPGGVGFDINCLSPDTYILNELGYKIKIEDYKDIFEKEKLICMDFCKMETTSARVLFFLKQKPKSKVYKIKTETGKEITATSDHPFFTKEGMKEVSKLREEEEIALYPFEGVDYENPSWEEILTEEKIKNTLISLGKNRGNAISQILKYLKERKLLPLRYNSPATGYLIKIMGYCFGDGSVYFTNQTQKGVVCFYGEEEDLKEVKKDLEKIGFKGGNIYSRCRKHSIKTFYSQVEFERDEFVLKISSSSLAVLLVSLGLPLGNKCVNNYNFPEWIFKAPLWQKRLFLASLFGAELSSPKTINGYNFYTPILSLNKKEYNLKDGEEFLKKISLLLSQFKVETYEISKRKEYIDKKERLSWRLRLILKADISNLINLYGKIGFEYNRKRKYLSNCALHYLILKKKAIEEREKVSEEVLILHSQKGWGASSILNHFSHYEWLNRGFVERAIYEERRGPLHIGEGFLRFDEFIKKYTQGLGTSGMVWDKILKIEEVDGFDDYVYDFTVDNPNHNFIANNFVVSNCGVRLLKTNLTLKDIEGKISKLVDVLYQNVPSGVGSRGQIRVSHQEERRLLLEGARWAVKKGFGIEEDLEVCEERGSIEGADPDSVSERAYERGRQQAGTLGSGNHFLEVQVIDDIYDREVAEKLGLFIGQITVMIHSGSRGFGYQVCDDYVRVMIKCLNKYSIKVPDRQLACAPIESPEAKNYIGAMKAAANYAWANRQILMYLTRESFEKVFSKSWQNLGMYLIYDVAHNIAKFERYTIGGKEKTLCVHRKGATRAFGPGHRELPDKYKDIGQPVIIPGDMGRASYLLVGTKKAEEESFSSTCHGAGRLKSRHEAIRTVDLNNLLKELKSKGVEVRATGRRTIVEEAPSAYKDVSEVVEVVDKAGLSKKVCRMRPLCVVKG